MIVVALRKAGLGRGSEKPGLLAAGVLGHCLGTLADCMLGQLAGQVQPHGSLDLSAGDGVLLVVVGQTRGLGGDPLKDVIHEGVHDAHCLAGDASVRVHLLQHLVDVDGVALFSGLSLLLGFSTLGLQRGSLLSLLACHFAWHLWFLWLFSE